VHAICIASAASTSFFGSAASMKARTALTLVFEMPPDGLREAFWICTGVAQRLCAPGKANDRDIEPHQQPLRRWDAKPLAYIGRWISESIDLIWGVLRRKAGLSRHAPQ
jgi:hypothetical protein